MSTMTVGTLLNPALVSPVFASSAPLINHLEVADRILAQNPRSQTPEGLIAEVDEAALWDKLRSYYLYVRNGKPTRGGLPTFTSLAWLPVSYQDAFNGLINYNTWTAWMPRHTKSQVKDSGYDATTSRRVFASSSRHRETNTVEIKFNVATQDCHTQFRVRAEKMFHGAVQLWERNEPADFSIDEGTRAVEEITLVYLLAEDKEFGKGALLLHHGDVKPHLTALESFIAGTFRMFIKVQHRNEQRVIALSISNRALNENWTSRTVKDPLGKDLKDSSNPSGIDYKVFKTNG